MFEILGVIAAAGAIAAFARGRGGTPWLWAGLAVAGWILLPFLARIVLSGSSEIDVPLVSLIIGWAWVGAVALWTRFGLGASRSKPDGMWVCPNCKMLNQNYAVLCDACQQPYAKPATPGKIA